ncbi:MAG: ATP-binding cassette domain-containing protein [Syntrophobacteraceae bacterium]|nr:ATP-binding cassette domain-containing protein [Syntrophobacteraceae bacterium]
MLEGFKVSRRFGGLKAVTDFDFLVEKGKIVGLIGPNGSGKSTLFNVITGFYPADSGGIFFKGRDITRCKPYEIARMGIARTFQIVRPLLGLGPSPDLIRRWRARRGRGCTNRCHAGC